MEFCFFTILIEGSIFGLGSYLYIKTTKAENKKGSIGLWGLLMFLIVVYLMNILSPPPPSEKAIAFVGMFQWLIIVWGYWIDRNRKIVA